MNRTTESDLADVARVYLAAVKRREYPTRAVSDALRITREAAAQRVLRARRAGLLPPFDTEILRVADRCPACGAARVYWENEGV